jgi:hypothetical protein
VIRQDLSSERPMAPPREAAQRQNTTVSDASSN